jgi:uncharacterized LabA/DUF88 family protein
VEGSYFFAGGLLPEKAAILIDGGFLKKKLRGLNRRFPIVADVTAFVATTLAKPSLTGVSVFRVYFYDAPPYEGTASNPISGAVTNFSATVASRQNQALLQSLELQPDFAVRRGTLMLSGWKLGNAAIRSLAAGARPIAANDFVPDMGQKGVDMRIGLDIAWLSLKRIVDSVVLVTGDSDFVPAMKFARREGLRVYLEAMGHAVRRELKVHADIVL